MKNSHHNSKIILLFVFLFFFPPVLIGSTYSLLKSNIGGNGSEISNNLTHIRHSFSQESTVNVSEDENSEIIIRSGYLTPLGYPISIVNISPAPGSLKARIDEKIKIEFDTELDTSTVKDAISLIAIRDKSARKISQNIGFSYNFYNQNSAIEISPASLLHNHRYKLQIQPTITEVWGENLEARLDSWFHTQIYAGEENVYSPVFSDELKVNMPPGSVSKDKFYLKISTDLHNNPILTRKEDIALANSKLEIINVLDYYEIRGISSDDAIIKENLRSVGVELPVSKSYSARKSPPDTPKKRASKLCLYMLNEEKKLWVKVPAGGYLEDINLYKATVGKFGTLALIEVPTYDLKDAFAFPVPFTPNSNPNHKDITFTNLATKCTIKVFTVNGELVWEDEFEYPTKNPDEIYRWNVKNKDGKDVASGVYIYLITSREDSKLGKLMIIR